MKAAGLKVHGAFWGVLRKADGTAVTHRKDNLVLDSGLDFLCDALGKNEGRPAAMGWIAMGTGTAETDASQTALAQETARKAVTYSHTAGTGVLTISARFEAGEATGALTEAGIVNAAEGGTFFDRVTFGVINKAADDVYEANFEITFERK